MSNYILVHGQLRELSDNELMHWKYIKREKLANGKYKYYYDLGETQKKNYEQAKANYTNNRNQHESAWRNKKTPNAEGLNKADSFVPYWGNKEKEYDLKTKMDKAKAEYDKTPLGKREARAEETKHKIQQVKNWAKDKLGYDEKQAVESARVNAVVKKNEADDIEAKNSQWKLKYTDFDPYTGEASKKPGYDEVEEMADWQDNYYKEMAKEAEDEYIDAIDSYMKTPLGKLDKIRSGKERVEEWWHYSKLGDALGQNQQAIRDYYKKNYEFEPDGKYTSGTTFKEGYEKAQADYEETVLGKLEKARERRRKK